MAIPDMLGVGKVAIAAVLHRDCPETRDMITGASEMTVRGLVILDDYPYNRQEHMTGAER